MWKRINVRTYYQVNFDTTKLIDKAVKEINDHLNVSEIRIIVESGSMESIRDKEELEAGAAMSAAKVRTIRVSEAVGSGVKYDLIGDLVQITGLTRRTIVTILQRIEPGKFLEFKLNPEEFIIKTGRIINDCKALSLIQHIKYEKRENTFESDIFRRSYLTWCAWKERH